MAIESSGCFHDYYEGDLLTAEEVSTEYNRGMKRYGIMTKMNPNQNVYVDHYGSEWIEIEEEWCSTQVSTIELARAPVGVRSTQDVETKAFVWHWTEFMGGASSMESVVASIFAS